MLSLQKHQSDYDILELCMQVKLSNERNAEKVSEDVKLQGSGASTYQCRVARICGIEIGSSALRCAPGNPGLYLYTYTRR